MFSQASNRHKIDLIHGESSKLADCPSMPNWPDGLDGTITSQEYDMSISKA